MLREPSQGKIEKMGRVVMTIALAAATVILILAVSSLVGLVLQRNFQGQPTHDQAFHAPQPPEHAQP